MLVSAARQQSLSTFDNDFLLLQSLTLILTFSDKISVIKAAMAKEGVKEAVFEPAKLAQSNRQGRKIMQAYFRKKGVAVSFSA